MVIKMNPIILAQSLIFGVSIPILITFSPVFPDIIRSIIIIFWMIFLPFFFFKITSIQNLMLFLLSIFIISVHSYNAILSYPDISITYLIPLVLFSYICLSSFRYDKSAAQNLAIGLFFGAAAVNLVTLLIFSFIIAGYIDIIEVFSIFDRSVDTGVWRFSLGNAIEVPFLLTMCTVICYEQAKRYRFISMVCVLLNLIVALISQSRGVTLICIFHLLIYLRYIFFLAMPALLLFFIISNEIVLTIITETFDSLVLRFSGEDYGSASMRELMFVEVITNISSSSLLFGSGALSSSVLMLNVVGKLMTVEAAILQLVYEFGLIGSIIILSGFILNIIRQAYKLPIYMWAFFVQLFILLPVTASFAIFAILFLLYEEVGK